MAATESAVSFYDSSITFNILGGVIFKGLCTW